jgi:hypothetical protein
MQWGKNFTQYFSQEFKEIVGKLIVDILVSNCQGETL